MPTRVYIQPPTSEFPSKMRVEEQYELKERKKLTVDTTGTSYTTTTTNPALAIIIVDGDDVQLDTSTISDDSPVIKDGGSLSITLGRKQTTFYAKAVNTSANVYILIFG